MDWCLIPSWATYDKINMPEALVEKQKAKAIKQAMKSL